jgi:transcription initiation factor TFIIIB Brf1 subunit/transcription initiation factor TFIIB
MDMTRHLHRWLNEKALREVFDDRYTGRVATVTEETIRNRYTFQKQLEPIITFEDGWRLVPNIGQRRALIEFFGAETENWIGESFTVFLARVERKSPETGQVRSVFEKRVMRADLTSTKR